MRGKNQYLAAVETPSAPQDCPVSRSKSNAVAVQMGWRVFLFPRGQNGSVGSSASSDLSLAFYYVKL